jgi:hypothetical protein
LDEGLADLSFFWSGGVPHEIVNNDYIGPTTQHVFEHYQVCFTVELELELIQTHTTQKPLLWVEVGVHAVRKRSERAGVVWARYGSGTP